MSQPIVLFWHRRDLRLTDNLGLSAAWNHSPKVVGIFCFDPGILQRDDVAAVRVAYLVASLQELHQNYDQRGGQLLFVHQPPVQAIVQVAMALQVAAVYWNREVEPAGQQRDRQVQEALQHQGITVHSVWDQVLHDPATIATDSHKPYTVYTPFWKRTCRHAKAEPEATIPAFVALTAPGQDQLQQVQQMQPEVNPIPLPTAEDLGFSWPGEWVVQPGEAAAQNQLEGFVKGGLLAYQDSRNFPSQPGTSMLSTALKFGTIGIRTLWAAACETYDQARSDETRKQIETWQKELIWREFYYHALYHFPELEQGPYREKWKHFPWQNNPDYFQAWCEGKTGYPIVDAAMRQLNQTGWMHNRCRMIVASFLVKDLVIDWRWGEKYFMQHLLDGDLASNNGGWQWSASSGMDSKPLRIFNPKSQTQRYDAEGEYLRLWLPELSHVDTEALVTGKIAPLDRGDYPAPIVDHQQQQQRFKALYQALPS
jgi:deoxyribodipyrimidine photo-lyase